MPHPRFANEEAFEYYARLRRVKEHLQQHPSERLSLRKAAGVAGMAEKYFSVFFHAKTGVCFSDWARKTRIDLAMSIMRSRNHTVSGVASAVGFRDLRTFERAFKRQTAMTPREYKKSVRPS